MLINICLNKMKNFNYAFFNVQVYVVETRI